MTDDGPARQTPTEREAEALRMSGAKNAHHAYSALFEVKALPEHDSRRVEKLLIANTLALLANRDATSELAAYVRSSRDRRAEDA